MRRLLILCAIALTFACQPSRISGKLAPGAWDQTVRKALDDVISSNRDKDAYAVFDFDKTTIVHDISQALWVYQIEHLCYADAPSHSFLDGIPDTSKEIDGISFAEFGAILKEDFEQLSAILSQGKSLEEIHSSDIYLDFRTRMAVMLTRMDGIFGSEVSYLWMPGLLAGYTHEQAREVVHDAVLEHLGKDKLAVEDWNSPDGKWSIKVERGIYFPPEMKDLYNCRRKNGITPYVCSASMELIVEVLACDPELGLGLPPEQVFGLRMMPGEIISASYDSQYVQPIKDGKASCINKYIAPCHSGAQPILVAGDSNGDVPMLSSYPNMQHGLIIDVGRDPESKIGKLAAQARAERNLGRYLLQPAFAKASGEISGGGI